jgi:hypothetical protein
MADMQRDDDERQAPWFEISYFSEVGDGVASSSIGDLSDSMCYMRDIFPEQFDAPVAGDSTPELWSTFMRRDLEEFFVKWVDGYAFERDRRDLFRLANGVDPLVNAFMSFLQSGASEQEYLGLSTVLTWESGVEEIDTWTSQGFGANLTWRFRRDPDLQREDLHKLWHLLKAQHPGMPIDL